MAKRIGKIPKKFRGQIERQLESLPVMIQKRRKALGLTQEKLAENLEISIETMKAIESGRRYPSLPMLFYICLSLEISVEFKG